MLRYIDVLEIVEKPLGFSSSGLIVARDGKCYNSKGKERKPFDNGNGYLFIPVWVYGGGKAVQFYLHRLMAETFLGEAEFEDMQVNHKDGDKYNNSIENLEWNTPSQNIKHSVEVGLNYNRRNFGSTVFRKSSVMAKAYFYVRSGESNITDTAKKFGMSRTTLSSVMNKRSHKKVTDMIDIFFD